MELQCGGEVSRSKTARESSHEGVAVVSVALNVAPMMLGTGTFTLAEVTAGA